MIIKVLKIFGLIVLFIALTSLTQIGGIVLLANIPVARFLKRKFNQPFLRKATPTLSFLIIYTLVTAFILPPLAAAYGRVPMPVWSNDNLRPTNFATCLLNRHYVAPEMKEAAENIASKMQGKYPGTIVSYLDANFPFLDGFPLLPHLSHNDGEKLDLSFLYVDETGTAINGDAPAWSGYGVFEGPKEGERNTAEKCRSQGHWQYSVLSFFTLGSDETMQFDADRTKELIVLCNQQRAIKKIFIEPHLKSRLRLSSDKLRFHGCQAVRHDDHIHIQL